MNNIGGF